MTDTGRLSTLEAIARFDPAERLAALNELGLTRAGQRVPGLERFLDDEHPAVRLAAAQAVLQTKSEEPNASRAFDLLIDALTGPDADLSLAAGTAIVECTSDLSSRAAAALKLHQHPLLARVLGEMGGDVARRALSDCVEHSPSDAVRTEAREELSWLDEED